MSNLNWVDNVILFIFLASVLAGLMRGFIKEIISLISWIAAIFIAATFATRLAAMFTSSQQVQAMVTSASDAIGMNTAQPVSILATGISFIVLFAATLMIGSIVSYIFSSFAESGGISFINRILGALFGLARGFLVVLVIIFLVQLTSVAKQPWWGQSQFVNGFQPYVKQLSDIVSPEIQNLETTVGNTLKNVNAGQIIQDMRGGSSQ